MDEAKWIQYASLSSPHPQKPTKVIIPQQRLHRAQLPRKRNLVERRKHSQRKKRKVRIIVKVDTRDTQREDVDDADGDQSVVEVVFLVEGAVPWKVVLRWNVLGLYKYVESGKDLGTV